METTQEKILHLFEGLISLVGSIAPRNLKKVSDSEIVFADLVNGKLRHRTVNSIIDILDAIKDDSKPIGIILCTWDLDTMYTKEFPGLTTEEQQLLMHAFAESQDERRSFEGEDGD